ncbi:uncharacterized protein LOC120269467 [Dioscorea cayenensis subsp. rotundata]|uniref:Uncharacterized protein LOC120269467 n=1 Tax=Dioscorea cayennensis subsp. rotundata TaxID=55577 RepID=A0AB40C090_DIOCR|nr:uncharacterized protein LOC120269467 [Dioscorea cayenensis subsp. rotundata]
MGNSLRCCLACVLPCGALDVIRIVHINGHVEEFSRHVLASEILEANPNHVLSKPCTQQDDHLVRKIFVVSPESELKRGHIYFLIPSALVPDKKKKKKNRKKSNEVSVIVSTHQDEYLKETVLEKKVRHHRRRSGRVGVWRPHLESISEDL